MGNFVQETNVLLEPWYWISGSHSHKQAFALSGNKCQQNSFMGNSNDTCTVSHYYYDCVKWVKVFKNGPGKICGRRRFLEKNWKIIIV